MLLLREVFRALVQEEYRELFATFLNQGACLRISRVHLTPVDHLPAEVGQDMEQVVVATPLGQFSFTSGQRQVFDPWQQLLSAFCSGISKLKNFRSVALEQPIKPKDFLFVSMEYTTVWRGNDARDEWRIHPRPKRRVIPMEMFVQSPQPGAVDLSFTVSQKIRFLAYVSHTVSSSVLCSTCSRNSSVYRLGSASHSAASIGCPLQ